MGINSHVVETSDDAFEKDVLLASTPVLVDFWAEWCGPCRQIAPIIDELSDDMDGKLKVVKVNIDKNPETPQKYGVRGIPTLMVFKNGQPAATKVGSVPKSSLYEWVEKELA
ncbi:MAG: thioredoxin [Rickettsiales bacterium]|jgi:thioredoxin 1|nr:thioredoxin [Rickettsiales bacterium]